MSSSDYPGSQQSCGNPDRKLARFVIPGATLNFRVRGFWHRKGQVSTEKSPVVNISRRGLAFLTDNPPSANRVTVLVKYAENEDPMSLDGRVVYSLPRGTGLAYRFRVGVEFSPFSPKKGHNSLVSQGLLEYLEKIHGA
jgi:hypothetical protein